MGGRKLWWCAPGAPNLGRRLSGNGIGRLRGSLPVRPDHVLGVDNLLQLLLGPPARPADAHVLAELPGGNARLELHDRQVSFALFFPVREGEGGGGWVVGKGAAQSDAHHLVDLLQSAVLDLGKEEVDPDPGGGSVVSP